LNGTQIFRISTDKEKSEKICEICTHFQRSHSMYKVIRSNEIKPSPGGTVTFEGEEYGSGVSFFLVNNVPGAGPNLHKHPYSETWVIRSGKARLTADGVDIEAEPGDIIVVSPETPHKFKNMGTERLEIICIHASPRIIQEDLE
jgi:mannose-6-phosphate isomerase-like protein (cupin superfamily)